MQEPARRPSKRREKALPDMLDRVTFLVHRVEARIAQASSPAFLLHDIEIDSVRMLGFLLERKEMRVGDLVEVMVLPQSTISHQLQRLEKRGLIKRRRVAADNRAVAVTLTPKGRQVTIQCRQFSEAFHEQVLRDFSGEEVELLRGMLRRLFASIDNFRHN
jgi:DNA-binding MarR family transcriptional regulator